jgi:hypothetical protein
MGTTQEIRKKRGKQRNLEQEKDRSTSMMDGNEKNYGSGDVHHHFSPLLPLPLLLLDPLFFC